MNKQYCLPSQNRLINKTKTFEIHSTIVRKKQGRLTICIPKKPLKKSRSLGKDFCYPQFMHKQTENEIQLTEQSCCCEDCGSCAPKQRLTYKLKREPKYNFPLKIELPTMRQSKSYRPYLDVTPSQMPRRSFQLLESSPLNLMSSSKHSIPSQDAKQRALCTFKQFKTESQLQTILMRMVRSTIKISQEQSIDIQKIQEGTVNDIQEQPEPEKIRIPSLVLEKTSIKEIVLNKTKMRNRNTNASYRIKTEPNQAIMEIGNQKYYFQQKSLFKAIPPLKLGNSTIQTASMRMNSFRKTNNQTPTTQTISNYQQRLSQRIQSTYLASSIKLKRNKS